MHTRTAIGPVTSCQVCGARSLQMILRYGNQAIVQAYLTEEDLRLPEITYPLNLVFCASCGLLQLDYVADPRIVFPKNYPYRTGLTNMLKRNFEELAEKIIPTYGIQEGDRVYDIGSNDGTLLKSFKAHGMQVMGIEPTDAAKDASKNGIKTIQKFFNVSVAKELAKQYGKAKLVTASNVFAHIPNAPELAKAIAVLLEKDGVFVSESQYFFDTFEKNELDCIYHEHLRFYTLKPLQRLLSDAGMTIVDAERISAAGGSIRVFAKKGTHVASRNVHALIEAEERAGLYDEKRLKSFAKKALKAKRELAQMIADCSKKGVVAGLGSPARSNTLLGFTHIDKDFLAYLGEKRGSPKIGLLTPGTHIPVVDEQRIVDEQPPYLLVLSWHIGKELMDIMRTKGYKGKFIMPLPVPQIIEDEIPSSSPHNESGELSESRKGSHPFAGN